MKKFIIILLGFIFLTACGMEADYNTQELQEALDNGEDVAGKTALVEVTDVVENVAFGYVMEAGDTLHFINSVKPNHKEGDKVLVEIEKYVKFFDAYTILYREVEE